MLKSYRGDLDFAARLIESFNAHNPSGLSLFVVVPGEDLEAFAPLASDTVTVLSEEPLRHHFTETEINGIRPGYINQEIVKLSFWELGLADVYFTVDSDAVFIRDFGTQDFMRDAHTPYTVLVEDNELKVEPRYYREHWVSREQAIRHIQELVGLDDPIMRTCHGHQVMSAAVLASYRDEFLAPRGWGYADALAEAPYEFSWYAMWLQKSRVIPIHQIEPLVKTFHNEDQHLEYILRGITVDDIARGYLGLVINSNYSRELGVLRPDAPKPEALSPYLSYGEVAELITAKAKDTFRRRFRR